MRYSFLVRTVVRHGVEVARYNSCVGRNLLFCCDYFNWRLSDFQGGTVSLKYSCFRNYFISKLSSAELNAACSLSQVLLVRDGVLSLENFDRDEVDSIISVLSTC